MAQVNAGRQSGDPFEKLPEHLLVHILELGLKEDDLYSVMRASSSLQRAADQVMQGRPQAETLQVQLGPQLARFYDKYFSWKADELPKRVATYIMDHVARGEPFKKADFVEEFRGDLKMAQVFLGAFSKQLVDHAGSLWGQATQSQAENWKQSVEEQGRRARRASWRSLYRGDKIVVNNRSGLTPIKCTTENMTAYTAGRDIVGSPPARNMSPMKTFNKRPSDGSTPQRASQRYEFERFSDVDLPKTVYGVYLSGPGKGPCLYAFVDGRNLIKRMPERNGRPDVRAFCPTKCIVRFFQKCWEARVKVRFVLPPHYISSKVPQDVLPSQDPADIVQDGEYTRNRWLYTLQESHLIVPVKSRKEADDVQVLELSLDMVINKGKGSTVIFGDDNYLKHRPNYPQLDIDEIREDVSYNPDTKELFYVWLQQRWRKFNPTAAAQSDAIIAEPRTMPAAQEQAYRPPRPYLDDSRSLSPNKSPFSARAPFPSSSPSLAHALAGPDSPYPLGFDSPQTIFSPTSASQENARYRSPPLRQDYRMASPAYSSPVRSPSSYRADERLEMDYDADRQDNRISSHEIGRFSDPKDTNRSYPYSSTQDKGSRDSSKRLSYGSEGSRQRSSFEIDTYGQSFKYDTDGYGQPASPETDDEAERYKSRKPRDSRVVPSPKPELQKAGRQITDGSSHKRARDSDLYSLKEDRRSQSYDFQGNQPMRDSPASNRYDTAQGREYGTPPTRSKRSTVELTDRRPGSSSSERKYFRR